MTKVDNCIWSKTAVGIAHELIAVAVVIATLFVMANRADAKPVKLVPGSSFQSVFPFEIAEGIAVAPDGSVYVADRGDNRVQKFTASGVFVLMFGKGVNETTGGDICTADEIAKEGVKCKPGAHGANSGEFSEIQDLAVGPKGEVFVLDLANWRVAEYTSDGEFVLMLGKEVDETESGNVCTKASGHTCGAGLQSAPGSTEHGAFKFSQFANNVLVVGGPEGRVYVGDEGRVQEFDATGKWLADMTLAPACRVRGVAVDTSGNVYVTCNNESVVRKFDVTGKEITGFDGVVSPRSTDAEVILEGIALDSEGHLLVTGSEHGTGAGPFGVLLDATTGRLITRAEFASLLPPAGVAFDASGELYAVFGVEILVYEPLPVAELTPAGNSCKEGVASGTSATLDCILEGEVNPWGVAKTEVWFEWGDFLLLEFNKTPPMPVPIGEVPVLVSAEINGVRPNETSLNYRLAAYDEHVGFPEEALTSDVASIKTGIVAPWVGSELKALFTGATSAVFFNYLNPENAKTEYYFEYGTGEALEDCPEGARIAAEEEHPCTAVGTTAPSKSRAYGKIGTTQEARGLQPSTTYRYRLFGESKNDENTERLHTVGAQEGEFTTTASPQPRAVTGTSSEVTAGSALITGAVDPDGAPAVYRFELGVYAGDQTKYSVVSSGAVGAVREFVTESQLLTGLQPGTTYSYRVVIASGFGMSVGATQVFITGGLPEVLPVAPAPPLLKVPPDKFPKGPVVKKQTKCLRTQVRDKHGKCMKRVKPKNSRGKKVGGRRKR